MHQVVHDTSSGSKGSWFGLAVRLAGRAVLRPPLALALLSALWVFRARGWYRRPPFLPLPDRTYLRWRLYTAYGDADTIPPIEDVERFVRWRRAFFRR